MPIQTSSITTSQDGNLSINPTGTGEVFLSNETGGGEKPLAADNTGKLKQLDTSALLTLPQGPATGDLLVVQRNDDQYKLDASGLSSKGANPSPFEVTASPDFLGGSGTATDPYIISPATVNSLGGSARSEQQIFITGQAPDAQGVWEDLSIGTGFRFSQNAAQFNNYGSWSGYLTYVDTPASASGQVYSGAFKMGSGPATYFAWDVTQVALTTSFRPISAPNASPADVNFTADNKFGRVTGTYSDAPGPLTATGAALFGINGAAAGTSGTANAGDVIAIEFNEALVNSAIDGDVVTGSVSGPFGFELNLSLIVNKSPFAFSIPSIASVSTSGIAESSTIALTGINAKTQVTYLPGDPSSSMTSPEISIAGSWQPIPQDGSGGVDIKPGDSIRVRGTVGANTGSDYTLQLKIGTTLSTFTATTATGNPAVSQPSITSPVFASSDLKAPVQLTSSAFSGLNGATPHASTDWEVYEASFGPPQTSDITAVDETAFIDIFQTAPTQVAYGDFGGQEYVWRFGGSGSLDRSQAAKNAGFGNYNTFLERSSDGGKTFTRIAFQFTGGISMNSAGDTSGNSPGGGWMIYEPSSQRLIVTQYRRRDTGNPPPNLVEGSAVFYSVDGGFTWISMSGVASGFGQGGVRQDRNGNLMVSNIDSQDRASVQRSTDGGVSWVTVDSAGTTGGMGYAPGGVGAWTPWPGGTGYIVSLGQASRGMFSKAVYITNDWGVTWTNIGTTFPEPLKDKCCASDSSGNIIMLTDAEPRKIYKRPAGSDTWQIAANPTNPDPYPVEATCFAWDDENGQFTALTDSGRTLWTSPDGQDWTSTSITLWPEVGDDESLNNYFITNLPNDSRIIWMGWGQQSYWRGSSGSIMTLGSSSTRLDLENALNLEKMNIGDDIVQAGVVGGATGTINKITLVPPSLTIVGTEGIWPVGSRAENTSTDVLDPPGLPSEPIDSTVYSKVVESLDDTQNKTTYTLGSAVLDPSKAYYSRVRYKSGGTVTTSDWSSFNDFRTADSFIPDIGEIVNGGYFAGQILDNGIVYNLVVAPKTAAKGDGSGGSLEGEYGALDSLTTPIVQWRATSGVDVTAMNNEDYGGDSSATSEVQSYPLFTWLNTANNGPNAGSLDSTNGTGTGIGGFNDWYLPAKNELELIYRNLKPTPQSNATNGSGVNPSSLPAGTEYTSGSPSQTSVSSFRSGGGNSFFTDNAPYLSSSQKADETTEIWVQWFSSDNRIAGTQEPVAKNTAGHVRAVRRYAT